MKKQFRTFTAFALALLFAVTLIALVMPVPVRAANGYRVTIKPGKGMSLESGSLTQEVPFGEEFEKCIFLADDEYYFPPGYGASGSTYGLTVEHVSASRIDVYGTPIAPAAMDMEIVLPDASLAPPAYTIRFSFGEGLFYELDNGVRVESATDVKASAGTEITRRFRLKEGYYFPDGYSVSEQYGFSGYADGQFCVEVNGVFDPGNAKPGDVCVVNIPGAQKESAQDPIKDPTTGQVSTNGKIHVVINPGAFTEGSSVEQDVTPGEAMSPVTFTAAVGFLFPKEWTHDPSYGLTYTRDMNKMTISGTPDPGYAGKTITIQLPDGWFGVEYGPTQQSVVWQTVDPQNVTVTVSSSGDTTVHKMIKADVTSVYIPPNIIQYTAKATDSDGTVYTNTWIVVDGKNSSDDSGSSSAPPPESDGKAAPEPEKSGTESAEDDDAPLPFKDIAKENPYFKGIRYVYKSGIMNGVSATEFAPVSTLTRAMFVTILGRMDGIDPEEYTTSTFTDCAPIGTWNYEPYVEWAAKNGIVLGYGDGKFGPSDPVTNEQAVLMLKRYAKFLGVDDDSEVDAVVWPEGTKVSSWAADAVAWAFSRSVYPTETKAAPTEPAERGWMAQTIYNFVGVIVK